MTCSMWAWGQEFVGRQVARIDDTDAVGTYEPELPISGLRDARHIVANHSETSIAPVLRKAFEVPGPVLIGINVDYRDNHLLFANAREHLLN
jgi:hypothetical protein